MSATCPLCACTDARAGDAHALLALLADDDLDAAMEAGLCDARPCPSCDDGCNAHLLAARDGRRAALAARSRHRARAARLERLRMERERQRASTARPAAAAPNTPPAIPAAAADVLARALAKAAGRG